MCIFPKTPIRRRINLHWCTGKSSVAIQYIDTLTLPRGLQTAAILIPFPKSPQNGLPWASFYIFFINFFSSVGLLLIGLSLASSLSEFWFSRIGKDVREIAFRSQGLVSCMHKGPNLILNSTCLIPPITTTRLLVGSLVDSEHEQGVQAAPSTSRPQKHRFTRPQCWTSLLGLNWVSVSQMGVTSGASRPLHYFGGIPTPKEKIEERGFSENEWKDCAFNLHVNAYISGNLTLWKGSHWKSCFNLHIWDGCKKWLDFLLAFFPVWLLR